MIMKKLTKKDYLGQLRGVVEGVEMENKEDVLNFIDHEIELLSKKRTTQTKNQKENEILIEDMFNYLAGMDHPVTVTEFMKENKIELTNQRVSALFKKLFEAGRITKVIEKGTSYYSVENDGDVE